MKKSSKAPFNIAAEKIVDLKELKTTLEEIYTDELNVLERAAVYGLARPMGFAAGLYIGFSTVAKREDPSFLGYRDANDNKYVSGENILQIRDKMGFLVTNTKFQEKLDEIGLRAFDACTDHSDKLAQRKIWKFRG